MIYFGLVFVKRVLGLGTVLNLLDAKAKHLVANKPFVRYLRSFFMVSVLLVFVN